MYVLRVIANYKHTTYKKTLNTRFQQLLLY